MTDIKLIKKYKHGDSGAFEMFYQRYCNRLYSFIRQRTGESNADDIFDLKEITYWQGVMLFILFKILFSNDYTVNKSSSNGDKKTSSQWKIM